MADLYEIDFKELDDHELINKYDVTAAVLNAEDALTKGIVHADKQDTVRDIIAQYRNKHGLTDLQRAYLMRLTSHNTPEYHTHQKDFFVWYNSRADMQELYHFGMANTWYVPVGGIWLYKDAEGWDKNWEKAPASAEMFFRVVNDYSCKQFREIKRPQVFEEGELVVLRAPFVGDWRNDPYYEGSKTPDGTNLRIGTVMANTDKINNRSRAGKGSRNINVLWIGNAEPTVIPERMIKHHERKRRAKKA
jgi:hypothetical protein